MKAHVVLTGVVMLCVCMTGAALIGMTEQVKMNAVPVTVEAQDPNYVTPEPLPQMPQYTFQWTNQKILGPREGASLTESDIIVFACNNVCIVKEWQPSLIFPSAGSYAYCTTLEIPETIIEHTWNAVPTEQADPDNFPSEIANNAVQFSFEVAEGSVKSASVANLSQLRQRIQLRYGGASCTFNTGTYASRQAQWRFLLDGSANDDVLPPLEQM